MRPKKLSIVCSLLLAILACSKEEAPKEAPPPKVTVIVTTAQEVPLYQEFVGQYQFKLSCFLSGRRRLGPEAGKLQIL
jgi:hypothetical protein